MSPASPPKGADAASAGAMVIGAMVAGAAADGLGSLLGVAVALGLIGLFAGLAGGFALVYARFRGL